MHRDRYQLPLRSVPFLPVSVSVTVRVNTPLSTDMAAPLMSPQFVGK